MTRFTDNNSRFGHAIRKTADITDGRDGIPQIRRVLLPDEGRFYLFIFHRRILRICLAEEFPEDFEGVDIHRGFGVEFYVAEDLLRYFISDSAVEGNEHGFCDGQYHELLHYREMVADKRHKVLSLRAEAECYCKFEEESQMEIREIRAYRIQKKDVLFTPLEETLLIGPVLHDSVQDFAEEHGHGILEHVVTDSKQRIFHRQVPCGIKSGSRAFDDIGLQYVQRQEMGHAGLLSETLYKKTSPAIFFAEGMDDEGILTELGGMENYESGVLGHTISV